MIKVLTTHELRKSIEVTEYDLNLSGLRLDYTFKGFKMINYWLADDAAKLLKRFGFIDAFHEVHNELEISWKQDIEIEGYTEEKEMVAPWYGFIEIFTFSQYDALHMAVSLTFEDELKHAAVQAEREAREAVQKEEKIRQDIIMETVGSNFKLFP